MPDRTPESFFARLKRIPPQQRWAFAGVWIAGLFAHGYMLTNKMPNHDDIHCFWDKGGDIILGRWGLVPVGWLDGSFSSPWLLGLLSILLISFSAMLLVGLLRLSSPLFCGLAGVVLVTFPSVICTLAYMFTSDAYMLALLLAFLCVRLSEKGGWRRAAAAVCLILSMGLYQAYLGWVIALMIYSLLMRCLDDGAEFRAIFRDGLWDVGVLAAGVAGYLGVTRLVWAVTGIAPSSGYQGVDQMGRIDLQALPRQIWDCYRLFYNVFRSPSEGACTTPGLRLLLTSCELLAILLIGLGVLRQFFAGKRLEAALAALLGLLMPAGMNIIYLTGTGDVHTLMIYPMCMIPLVFLSQCERWNARLPECRRPLEKHAHTFGRWVCVCLVALLAGRYAIQANEAHLCLQINHTRRVSYWTTVVTRIKSLPEYDQWMPVVLITEDGWDRSTPGVWNDVEQFNDLVGIRMPMHTYSDKEFLDLYCGFQTTFYEPADYRDLPEVQEMPLYPHDGSIRLIDGVIVVKF